MATSIKEMFNKLLKKENNNNEVTKPKEKSYVSFKRNSVSSIKKNTPVFVIGVDVFSKEICIFNMIGTNISSVNVQRIPYKCRLMDNEFFEKLDTILSKYLEDKPSTNATAVYIVFPNESVSIDMINIPTVSKRQMSSSLKVSLESSYKNIKDLLIMNQVLFSNKQYSTYEVLSVRKDLLADYFSTLAKVKMFSKCATYLANSLISCVFHMMSKNKGRSFIFFDLKKDHTNIAFCNKGKTIGFYSLQYGYKVLESNKLVYENMLSNHDLAEITVLNAKEKAKSKQLTVLDDSNSETIEDGEVKTEVLEQSNKKVPKKLPKFMQRPIPENDEDMKYENFRIFVKWALLLNDEYIRKNANFIFEYVMFNFPSEYKFVIDKTNEELGENKLEFRYFDIDESYSNEIKENLELYGALFMAQYNKNQVF